MSKQSGSMPFNLRNMEDERKARMGVVECVTHKLIEPFQVLFEKEGKCNPFYGFIFLPIRYQYIFTEYTIDFSLVRLGFFF